MVNKFFYRFGIVVLVAGVTAAFLQHIGIIDPLRLLHPCTFHQLSGLYCPGCGGTRAVRALLEGDLISCLIYHPFVFYCFVMYVLFMVSHSIAMIQKRKKTTHKNPFVGGLDFKVSYVYIGIIIILLQWMVKNIIVLCSSY